jgi:hypothetical protein
MEMMKPSESAEKIYNEFRDLILSDLTTEELIKKCAEQAVHIVYNSGPTVWEWEEYTNKTGGTNFKMVNIEPCGEFWTEVRYELEKF